MLTSVSRASGLAILVANVRAMPSQAGTVGRVAFLASATSSALLVIVSPASSSTTTTT